MPAAVFQKMAPRYSKNIFVVRKTEVPAHTPWWVAVLEMGEDEVVEPSDERELGDLLRRAVAGDPVEEVLVVERAEAAPVSDEPVGEHPAHGRCHDRDEVPGPAQVGVLVDQPVKRLVSGCERAVERLHRRRDAGAIEHAAQLRGRLEDRGQHAHAEPVQEHDRAIAAHPPSR